LAESRRSAKFIEITVAQGDVKRESFLIAVSAIKFVKADGANKCLVVLTDKTEFKVPGVSYEDFKKKLGVG
jgi:hypothetical protein